MLLIGNEFSTILGYVLFVVPIHNIYLLAIGVRESCKGLLYLIFRIHAIDSPVIQNVIFDRRLSREKSLKYIPGMAYGQTRSSGSTILRSTINMVGAFQITNDDKLHLLFVVQGPQIF